MYGDAISIIYYKIIGVPPGKDSEFLGKHLIVSDSGEARRFSGQGHRVLSCIYWHKGGGGGNWSRKGWTPVTFSNLRPRLCGGCHWHDNEALPEVCTNPERNNPAIQNKCLYWTPPMIEEVGE